jgi:hypothetical protein
MTYWDWWFESRWRLGYLFPVSVVCLEVGGLRREYLSSGDILASVVCLSVIDEINTTGQGLLGHEKRKTLLISTY